MKVINKMTSVRRIDLSRESSFRYTELRGQAVSALLQVIGKVVPVLSELSTTSWRRMGEWRYRATFS
jgi:hypothetical protein